MKREEKEFQKWLREEIRLAGGWSSSVEYAIGGDDGYPDMTFLFRGEPILAELKIAEVWAGERVCPSAVRTSQVIWHREFCKAGGTSHLFFGVRNGTGWDIYAIVGRRAHEWEKGWEIGTEITKVFNYSDNLGAAAQVFRYFAEHHN